MRALIAEDEAHIAADLRWRLERLWPDLEVAKVVEDGPAAQAWLAENDVDVAFLDIRMPGASGLEVAAGLTRPCLVVFVTAYDQYAVAAFEQAAADYVMKPFTDERLATMVARLKERLAARIGPDLGRLADLLAAARPPAQPQRLKWLRASLGDTVRLVAVDEVCYFEARDKYTSVWTACAEYVIRTPLKELEGQLDPERFWRIHRGVLVNAERIAAARPDGDGRLVVTLRDRPETLPVARAFAHLFRRM